MGNEYLHMTMGQNVGLWQPLPDHHVIWQLANALILEFPQYSLLERTEYLQEQSQHFHGHVLALDIAAQAEEDGPIGGAIQKGLHVSRQRFGWINVHPAHWHHGVHCGTCRG